MGVWTHHLPAGTDIQRPGIRPVQQIPHGPTERLEGRFDNVVPIVPPQFVEGNFQARRPGKGLEEFFEGRRFQLSNVGPTRAAGKAPKGGQVVLDQLTDRFGRTSPVFVFGVVVAVVVQFPFLVLRDRRPSSGRSRRRRRFGQNAFHQGFVEGTTKARRRHGVFLQAQKFGQTHHLTAERPSHVPQERGLVDARQAIALGVVLRVVALGGRMGIAQTRKVAVVVNGQAHTDLGVRIDLVHHVIQVPNAGAQRMLGLF